MAFDQAKVLGYLANDTELKRIRSKGFDYLRNTPDLPRLNNPPLTLEEYIAETIAFMVVESKKDLFSVIKNVVSQKFPSDSEAVNNWMGNTQLIDSLRKSGMDDGTLLNNLKHVS